MTVTIYANGVPIPEEKVDELQIMNKELIALLCSIKKRIQEESSSE